MAAPSTPAQTPPEAEMEEENDLDTEDKRASLDVDKLPLTPHLLNLGWSVEERPRNGGVKRKKGGSIIFVARDLQNKKYSSRRECREALLRERIPWFNPKVDGVKLMHIRNYGEEVPAEAIPTDEDPRTELVRLRAMVDEQTSSIDEWEQHSEGLKIELAQAKGELQMATDELAVARVELVEVKAELEDKRKEVLSYEGYTTDLESQLCYYQYECKDQETAKHSQKQMFMEKASEFLKLKVRLEEEIRELQNRIHEFTLE